MAPIIPVETLSHFLSKTGFPKFKSWFDSINDFKPISNDIHNLIYIIDSSTWMEDKLRKDSMIKIKEIIIKYLEMILNQTPDKHFQQWIDSIQPYCFQGGFGHHIQYSGRFPHHWCVRPEYYDKVADVPEMVKVCGVVCDKYVNLAHIAENEIWNN